MGLEYIKTSNAPAAVGPYNQAVKAGNMVFVSGQLPFDTVAGEMVTSGIEAQAAQCMKNVLAILAEAKLKPDDIVKTTIYLKDMNDFTKVNEVYASFFSGAYPARVCVEISRLPKDVDIEIDAIACY
jgi:2-iminobutanoate/2-iminopropanoate deaminase